MATLAVRALQRTANDRSFAVGIACFMPDHMHALVEGRLDCADLRGFVCLFKQRTAVAATALLGERLWQKAYYEHVLRRDEATNRVIRYIAENPVRAGLVASPFDYPYTFSDLGDLRDVLA